MKKRISMAIAVATAAATMASIIQASTYLPLRRGVFLCS